MGTQLPLKGCSAPPHFSAHVYCDERAGWIKMPLGTKIGLGPGDIVLDGDPDSHPKRGTAPPFSAHVYCGQTVAHLSYCWALVCRYLSNYSTLMIEQHIDCELSAVALYWSSSLRDRGCSYEKLVRRKREEEENRKDSRHHHKPLV